MANLIVFIAPILLIILIGILIRSRGNPETAGRRYFLFLIWTSIGSLAMTLPNWIFPHPLFGYGVVLFPVIPGLVVLTLLHWHQWNSLSRRVKIPILSAVGILLATIIVQLVRFIQKGDTYQLESIYLGIAPLAISVIMFIVWKWGNRYPLALFVINVLYLTFFLAFDMGSLSMFSESVPGRLQMHHLSVLAYLAIPSMTIPVMAMLTAGALNTFSTTADETRIVAWSPILGRLALVFLLFGLFLYVYRWLWLWDGIEDGIRGFILILVAAIAAISAGIVISMTASGWRRWTALVFVISVLVPTYWAAITGFGNGEGDTNYSVTEERAARIQEAIESHHAKTGWYPLTLAELVPGELWRVPLPMIMPGQGWCYQGGSNYYRLGAVYREHWSSPYREVRVYASGGNIPEETWECDEKLADAIAQSNFYGPPPAPVPLPTSVASNQKIIVEPVVRAESISLSSWSPDGAYLIFGLTEYFMTDGTERVAIDLRFLEASTGNVCQPSQSQWRQSSGLYDHSAWLPDGRLLYLTDAGEVLAFTPCVPGAEDLTSRIPVGFTQVAAVDKHSGHILMKNEDAYWLMDGISLELRKIEGVPTESYWISYAWSPGGKRLAISLMSGPEAEDEASLYIVDWATAEVTNVFPLADASDEYLPHVGWLTPDELLVHGKTVTIMDFRSEPPVATDVLKEIFLLDIAYPIEVWGMDTVSLKDGTGYFIGVQVNHPRNQGSYIYSSVTGQVEIFNSDVSGLIFLPDGQWMRLLKWEDPPTTRDEYDLVWLDGSHEPIRLTVEGHTPRAHFQIFPGYMPVASQLVFSSSQGISLVSIPDGETIRFWDISSDADYFSVNASPNGDALIVESGGDGLYFIPIPSQ
jgi:WD40 repeat protein